MISLETVRQPGVYSNVRRSSLTASLRPTPASPYHLRFSATQCQQSQTPLGPPGSPYRFVDTNSQGPESVYRATSGPDPVQFGTNLQNSRILPANPKNKQLGRLESNYYYIHEIGQVHDSRPIGDTRSVRIIQSKSVCHVPGESCETSSITCPPPGGACLASQLLRHSFHGHPLILLILFIANPRVSLTRDARVTQLH